MAKAGAPATVQQRTCNEAQHLCLYTISLDTRSQSAGKVEFIDQLICALWSCSHTGSGLLRLAPCWPCCIAKFHAADAKHHTADGDLK